ncbi:MAG TPA: tetratricopeptide repeat protein, partial [Gemmataceae bacterium]
MTPSRRAWLPPLLLLSLAPAPPAAAGPPAPAHPLVASGAAAAVLGHRLPPNPVTPGMAAVPFATHMPLTRLAPARLFPGLCVYHYRAGTTSEMCQKYVDQALGFYYSYVWMEAARSFETALRYDPDCALAWWGLSRSLEKWDKKEHVLALRRAQELLPTASYREQMLIRSRLEEKGMLPGVKPDERDKKAAETLDELLTLYGDDEEGWFCRAQLAARTGGGTAAVPYYKALLRINPLHPGANHELVHFYENWKRPALGWPYAEKYIESSPGLPHAFHMQAHLAMRIGKWDKTTDRSARAVELEKAYHAYQDVPPREDHQYSHHLEILTISLVHDGRFREARQTQAEARRVGYKHWDIWFRLHRAERDWAALEKLLKEYRKVNKGQAAYQAALMYLDRGEPDLARPEINVLREEMTRRKRDKRARLRYWEAQGCYLCQTGGAGEGLKLLERAVKETVDDFRHHAWGGGAYYMETWGLAALGAGNAAVAEEGFLEALAHDAGSVRGALGMQMLCEQLGRSREAQRFAAVARRCWAKADPGRFEALAEEVA